MAQKVAVYGDIRLPLPEGATTESARNALSSLYSEVKTANVQESGDEIIFTVQAGTKGNGQKVAVYGDIRLPLPEGATVESARNALSSLYSEVKTANVQESGDEIIFTVQAGTKGN